MQKYLGFYLIVLAWSPVMAAETMSHPDSVARIVVTADSYYQNPPALTADDVIVRDGYKPVTITALVPLRDGRADLEIYLLMDKSSNWDMGQRFMELHDFLASQPATTSIGVAYIQDGRLEVAQRPTHDRELVLQALTPPSGSTPSNPFRPLAELIEGWHADSSRHVVLMISDGIDPGASGVIDESVETALNLAQRAGVMVYSIYHPGAAYLTAGLTTVYSGQIQLAHLATESGGDAYFHDLGPLPSFAPILADIGDHLANQYLLEFETNVETRGAMHEVAVTTKLRDVQVTAPWRVWVPGSLALTPNPLAKRVGGQKKWRRQ